MMYLLLFVVVPSLIGMVCGTLIDDLLSVLLTSLGLSTLYFVLVGWPLYSQVVG